MPDQKPNWRILIPVLLIVLLLGTTFGAVCHTHVNCSPLNCPLCHLAIEPSVAGAPSNCMITAGSGPEVEPVRQMARMAVQRIPARAPPA
ncbi:MAG TPA: hypothetical protein VMV57_07320 [Terracidiphilus sp.]|nr:hypothetical protein [Terracidiphilus sp.]